MELKKDYIVYRGRTCEIVTMKMGWFDYRHDEEDLPKVGAFCKKCAKETARPVYAIYMNGIPAYALRCPKCGSEYPMYKHTYIERYIGYDTINGGHVNPTHGMLSVTAAMDRKAKNYHNDRDKRVEDKMCKAFGFTHEEYTDMKKEWEKEDKKVKKRLKKEQAEQFADFEQKQREITSNKRKELIEKGILKYVKNVGLVNTQTGEIVKL